MKRAPLLIIAGPTATGKSAVAVQLAQRLRSEVVSADSMQVYKYMDIGTAKIGEAEKEGVSHHMLDLVEPDDDFSLARYKQMATAICLNLAQQGKIPVLAGGTGLYIKAITENYPLHLLPHDRHCRCDLEKQWRQKGGAVMYRQLAQVDPLAASRINPADRRRIIRALEVYSITGRAPAEIQRQAKSDNPFAPLVTVLDLPRNQLYRRIDQRAEKMVNSGLVGEYNKLIAMGYPADCNAMQGLGYRHSGMYVKGLWTKEQMLALLQRDTRRFAKRQLSWFRAMADICWLKNTCPAETIEIICHLLQEKCLL